MPTKEDVLKAADTLRAATAQLQSAMSDARDTLSRVNAAADARIDPVVSRVVQSSWTTVSILALVISSSAGAIYMYKYLAGC